MELRSVCWQPTSRLVRAGKLLSIQALGRRDSGKVPLDLGDNGVIEIDAYSGFYSLFQPDAIAYQRVGGRGYTLIANEGDARDGENVDVAECAPT